MEVRFYTRSVVRVGFFLNIQIFNNKELLWKGQFESVLC